MKTGGNLVRYRPIQIIRTGTALSVLNMSNRPLRSRKSSMFRRRVLNALSKFHKSHLRRWRCGNFRPLPYRMPGHRKFRAKWANRKKDLPPGRKIFRLWKKKLPHRANRKYRVPHQAEVPRRGGS